jgi:hypothetical protein
MKINLEEGTLQILSVTPKMQEGPAAGATPVTFCSLVSVSQSLAGDGPHHDCVLERRRPGVVDQGCIDGGALEKYTGRYARRAR